jgi:hypothetical protein
MDQLITSLLSGDLDAASLLLLFIVGILTKRFVPWWIHEEVLEKLDEYEKTAPALLDEVSLLIELINEPKVGGKTTETVPDLEDDEAKREAVRRIIRKRAAVVHSKQRKRTR